MTTLSLVTEKYQPKSNFDKFIKEDLSHSELKKKYPTGCICCDKLYTPTEYSKMISQHFKTKKHQKNVIDPANLLFYNDFKNSNDINQLYEEKCKENRILKKVNYEYSEKIKELEALIRTYKVKTEDLLSFN